MQEATAAVAGCAGVPSAMVALPQRPRCRMLDRSGRLPTGQATAGPAAKEVQMPEGDTVWLHARRLDRTIGRRTLVASDFRVPSLATTDLTGSTVREVASRGKHLLVRLRTPGGDLWTLRSHLRMDGTWRVFRPGQRWSGRPAHTIRIVLTTDAAVA